MITKENQEREIAAEIDDFFLHFTEILWSHLSLRHKENKKNILNVTEYFVIDFLGKESFASMSRLSKIVNVAPTTMTSIVDRLIRSGLLERRRGMQDRRKVLVNLSKKGKQFYHNYHSISIEVYARFLSTLPDKGRAFGKNIREIKEKTSYLKKHFEDNQDDG